MRRRRPSAVSHLPGRWFALVAAFMTMLCIAGGASRADALGQTVVRLCAVLVLLIVVLCASRRGIEWPRATWILVLATAALPALQLIPLPPGLWQALPGHALLAGAVDGPQPWRPLTIQPNVTLNALLSLLVPIALLGAATIVPRDDRPALLPLLLVLICVAAVVGLAQFAGSRIDNPFVNDLPGEVSGLLANRNHLALLLAIGCLCAPVWSVLDRPALGWRAPFAVALLILFLLIILASGSRAGALIGGLAALTGLAMARREWLRIRKPLPRWVEPVAGALLVLVIAGFMLASFAADRAQSINRAVAMVGIEDLRTRALPTVLEVVRTYFPVGSGFGTFDTAFRVQEPFDLLKPTFFNHAHDDFLEVVQGGGLAAALLLLAAVGWWLVATVRIWRRSPSPRVIRGRLGSTIILLVLFASVTDYPARTPVVMGVLVLAAIWLEWGLAPSSRARS